MGTSAQAQNIQAGLWEVRMVKQLVNGVDQLARIAAQQQQMKAAIAKMPPEQRKQMESMLAGAGAGGMGGAQRICISPAMAKQDQTQVPANAGCEAPVIQRAGNVTNYTFSCQQGGNTVKGKGQSEAAGDRVVSRMDTVTTGPQGKHTMQMESQMRFVSADCGSVKPADQLLKSVPAKR